jgi:hypothetical protein
MKTPISGGIGVFIFLREWQVGQWRWKYWKYGKEDNYSTVYVLMEIL